MSEFTQEEIQKEAERLLVALAPIDCEPGRTWDEERCLSIAPLTLKINKLKKEKDAVILAHSYVYPEIIYGVADFKGDSYFLSDEARKAKAKNIIFSGVVFMAETAKILSPEANVFVPDRTSGCSLADSLTGDDMKSLKARYPKAAVVCYINSSAEVKAYSDVCVTSTNVYDIVANLPQDEILFVPDKLMADNIRTELRNRGVRKSIYSSSGTCIVHDEYSTQAIHRQRDLNPHVKVVAHPECPEDVTRVSDFVGSTSQMMNYVKNSSAEEFMILSECGLVGRLQHDLPNKKFVNSCRLCPYMKKNELQKILDCLESPHPSQVIELNEDLRLKAKACIDKMFELAP